MDYQPEAKSPYKAVLVVIVVAVVVLLLALTAMFQSGDVGTGASGVPTGSYMVKGDVAAADSLDNLVQIDECIRRHDQDCIAAMVSDDRVVLVKAGTMVDATDIGNGALIVDVRSGSQVGKRLYMPTGAVK